jgi:hypothetical protein
MCAVITTTTDANIEGYFELAPLLLASVYKVKDINVTSSSGFVRWEYKCARDCVNIVISSVRH